MTEILFYHLERQPLDQVLPSLLEKTRERGWRAVIRTATSDRAVALDEHLWTYREESFLPHALASHASPGEEPIVIAIDEPDLNDPQVSFHIEGASLPETPQSYERIVVLFDGNDAAALETARKQWKDIRDQGLAATYWQQNEQGRWEKKA
ncbi:MAG: DNA polymerase III subunit chi [Hyphomicrobiales bacterium]|jgi:DNA polymerase-3 subunit chi|nr:DNA polymerase III subunit chi [Hyphomicrobiales bacterium]NBR10827.1 DNA polymerase III subunit chi [Alphaproteobacteria bacterium]